MDDRQIRALLYGMFMAANMIVEAIRAHKSGFEHKEFTDADIRDMVVDAAQAAGIGE